VNEIIIFDESLPENDPSVKPPSSTTYGRSKYRAPADQLDPEAEEDPPFNPSHFVARILEYLECPQYVSCSTIQKKKKKKIAMDF
jgi:predicted SPOUT superfamily RNA methylase MTH1